MKRTLKQSQLENMISECVGQVLAESRQPRRQSMNEAQLSRYIQNIINEEMEDEGLLGRLWGGAKGIGNAARGEYNKAKQGVMNTGLGNEYSGQNFKKRVGAAKNMIKAQARQGDTEQELNNLKNTLYKLELNGYFNKATQPIADKLYKALDVQLKSGENLQVKGAYKKGYGQSMPQSQSQGNGMGSTRRNTSWDPNGFGSGAAM